MLGILNGSKEVAKLANTGLSLIDKAFYTKEEQAADQREVKKELAMYTLKWLDASKGQNIARRVIALMIMGVWVATYTVGLLAAVGAVFTEPELSAKLVEVSALLKDSAEELSAEVMLILGFYFAMPHLGKFVEPITERMKQKQIKQEVKT